MTPDELDAAIKATCPVCASGNKPRWREETKEWTHDVTTPLPGKMIGGNVRHTFCLATGLRKTFGEKIGD